MRKQTNSNDKSLTVAMLAAFGSGLEYYDFVVYGMMAQYLAKLFFSTYDEYTNIIQIFIIFAVGYIARPFGGAIIGMIADTYGRKIMFSITMLTMAFSTFIIGLLPTYNQIGIFSPIALLACRVCQGISFGAELPGATTIVTEFAQSNRLGKLCSLIISGTVIGSLLATCILALLTNIFSEQEIIDWAWRIPFIIGGILAIASYYMRQNITETPAFLVKHIKRSSYSIITPLKILLSQNYDTVFIGVGCTFFLATMVIINLYFPVYLNKNFGYEPSNIYNAMTISMILSFVFILCFGRLADYISRIKITLISIISCVIFLFIFLQLLYLKSSWIMQVFLILYQMHIAAFFTSYMPILSRLFVTDTRYTGVAIVYNIAFSLASIMPSFASYLIDKYDAPLILLIFFVVASIVSGISIVALIIKNRHGTMCVENYKWQQPCD